MSNEERLVHLAVSGGVATVTLDSSHNRNALSARLQEELHAALVHARDDETVRVIVLTGAGPVFCAGADLKEQRSAEPPRPAVSLPEILTLLWESQQPVIARVNGPTRAGGIGLVAACDIAVAPREATFGFSEVRIGVVPAIIAVTCLRRIEPRAAEEYFLTGETFDADRAQRIGLVNRAVPRAELDQTVEHYVDMLLRGAPRALTIAKDLVRTVPGYTVGEGLRRMSELSVQRFASDEAREGMSAFAEKRDPAWVPAERRAD